MTCLRWLCITTRHMKAQSMRTRGWAEWNSNHARFTHRKTVYQWCVILDSATDPFRSFKYDDFIRGAQAVFQHEILSAFQPGKSSAENDYASPIFVILNHWNRWDQEIEQYRVFLGAQVNLDPWVRLQLSWTSAVAACASALSTYVLHYIIRWFLHAATEKFLLWLYHSADFGVCTFDYQHEAPGANASRWC